MVTDHGPDSMVTDPGRCTANVRSTGEQCRRRAIRGGTVCAVHGGQLPRVKARAAERVVEAEALSTLARLGTPAPLGHPVEELLAVVAEQKAWQVILRERLAEHIDQARTLETVDKLGTERERALVVLYERALDRTGAALAGLVKLDLADRAVRIREAEAATVRDAIVATLSSFDLTPNQLADARARFARELRERRIEVDAQPIEAVAIERGERNAR